jgi:hypothetical protein
MTEIASPVKRGGGCYMMASFRHLSNVMLARILESDPTRIRRHELDQALGWTLDALGRDAVNPDVSETAFEGRRDAARNADDALRQRKNKQALQALQRCWLT